MIHSFLLFPLSAAKLVRCTPIVSALKHFKIPVCGIFKYMNVNKPPVLQKLEWLWLVRLVGCQDSFTCGFAVLFSALAELLRSSSESLELFSIFAFLIISKCMQKNDNQSWKLYATLLSLMEVLRFCVWPCQFCLYHRLKYGFSINRYLTDSLILSLVILWVKDLYLLNKWWLTVYIYPPGFNL